MSSPPSDSPAEQEPRDDDESPGPPDVPDDAERSQVQRWWDRVEPWRRLMLGGAVILLLAAAAQVRFGDDFPELAVFATNFGGYILLALGFAQFFRDRRNK